MSEYTVRALTSRTWDAFADLCARYNGAGFGGYWCTWFHNATRHMCERAGFTYDRPKGKNHCVMRKVIEPSG